MGVDPSVQNGECDDGPVSPEDVAHLRRCIELAGAARAAGNEPFGSLLVGGDGTVLAEAMNTVGGGDITGHPELELARWASRHLSPPQREAATMYTSCEHCAMCAGAFLWAGLGRLVFALSGAQVIAMAPPGPTLDLPVSDVFARGNRTIVVDGPCAELAGEAAEVFAGFWDATAE